MKNFQVTITEFNYKFGDYVEQVIDTLEIPGATILDAIKALRKFAPDYCYGDEELVEWINSEDGWDDVVDDEFIMDLVHEEDGKYYVMLSENMEFVFEEI